MLSKWQWILSQLTRTLWIRASLFAVLAIITALIAIPIQRYFDLSLSINIGSDSVGNILNILASSMLAVTTFSLSTMVAAYSAASSTVSPRATKLVQQDTTSQNVLATFIGSFLYSLVGIIALSTHAYGKTGRLILFIVTIAVVLLIVVTILRWIEHLSILGRLSETTDRVEEATVKAITERINFPYLNAKSLKLNALPSYQNNRIYHDTIGYIQHIDINALDKCAKEHDAEVAILATPGEFIHLKSVIACCSCPDSEELNKRIRAAYTVANERSFDQDPGFGISVLTEIASRALSDAVNDPGTALEVINRSVRILSKLEKYNAKQDDDQSIEFSHVRVPELSFNRIFEDLYLPIARDGASMVEIQLALQNALLALRKLNNENLNEHIVQIATLAYQHAEYGLVLGSNKDAVNEVLQKTLHYK